LPELEEEEESRDCVVILPLMVDIEIPPPFSELPELEEEEDLRDSVVILPPASKSIAPPFSELPELEEEVE
jgi:hypothetical protein